VKISKLVLPHKPSRGRAPKVTIAVDPNTATVFRTLARAEHMLISDLLAQALVAWIRRWRPDYEVSVEGDEGPPHPVGTVSVDATAAVQAYARRAQRKPSGRAPAKRRAKRTTKRR
jgi:hypothetical protein